MTLFLDDKRSLIKDIPFLSSPHCDERPQDAMINLLVVHGISLPPGQFGGEDVHSLFLGHLNCESREEYVSLQALKVSAHLFINRLGQVVQFVPFQRRAWHAGVSSFEGVTSCNDYSIGIELEGTDDTPYEKAQYARLAEVIKLLMQYYPNITKERIVGHQHIAPGRKTDPGPLFDWDYLKGMLT